MSESPEERAAKALLCAESASAKTVEALIGALDTFYAAEIRAAVAAEREGCAMLIDGWYVAASNDNPPSASEMDEYERMAAAIRARGEG